MKVTNPPFNDQTLLCNQTDFADSEFYTYSLKGFSPCFYTDLKPTTFSFEISCYSEDFKEEGLDIEYQGIPEDMKTEFLDEYPSGFNYLLQDDTRNLSLSNANFENL